MNDKRIKVGDKVMMIIAQGMSLFGTVEYMPVATGDCWIINSDKDGLNYVQSFLCMTRVEAH